MGVGEGGEDGLFDRGVVQQVRRHLLDEPFFDRDFERDEGGDRTGQILGELGADFVVVEQLFGDFAGTVGVEHGLEGDEPRPRERPHEQREAEDRATDRPADHRRRPGTRATQDIDVTVVGANSELVSPSALRPAACGTMTP